MLAICSAFATLWVMEWAEMTLAGFLHETQRQGAIYGVLTT